MADRTHETPQEAGKTPIAERPSEAREQARELGTQVHEEARAMGTQARDWAEEKGSQMKEGAQEALHQGEASASQLADLGHTAMDQLEESLAERIRHKPLQSVLIAAGAGLLLGFLWKK